MQLGSAGRGASDLVRKHTQPHTHTCTAFERLALARLQVAPARETKKSRFSIKNTLPIPVPPPLKLFVCIYVFAAVSTSALCFVYHLCCCFARRQSSSSSSSLTLCRQVIFEGTAHVSEHRGALRLQKFLSRLLHPSNS